MKRKPAASKLTAEEKRDRDARAQHWMNLRKIERVAEAAARHGWHQFPADDFKDTKFTLVETEGLPDVYLFSIEDRRYRYEGSLADGVFLARRIA